MHAPPGSPGSRVHAERGHDHRGCRSRAGSEGFRFLRPGEQGAVYVAQISLAQSWAAGFAEALRCAERTLQQHATPSLVIPAQAGIQAGRHPEAKQIRGFHPPYALLSQVKAGAVHGYRCAQPILRGCR